MRVEIHAWSSRANASALTVSPEPAPRRRARVYCQARQIHGVGRSMTSAVAAVIRVATVLAASDAAQAEARQYRSKPTAKT